MNKPSPSLELLCVSKNGVSVYYDPVSSHAATHIEDTPHLKELAIEAIQTLELHGEKVATYVNLGRDVGVCDLVAVGEGDDVVWAVRKNRQEDGLVQFVKGKKGEPCPYVTVMLDPRADGSYILFSTWIGVMDNDHQPFPQSAQATAKSVPYWRKLAFIYGYEEMLPETETTVAPW